MAQNTFAGGQNKWQEANGPKAHNQIPRPCANPPPPPLKRRPPPPLHTDLRPCSAGLHQRHLHQVLFGDGLEQPRHRLRCAGHVECGGVRVHQGHRLRPPVQVRACACVGVWGRGCGGVLQPRLHRVSAPKGHADRCPLQHGALTHSIGRNPLQCYDVLGEGGINTVPVAGRRWMYGGGLVRRASFVLAFPTRACFAPPHQTAGPILVDLLWQLCHVMWVW